MKNNLPVLNENSGWFKCGKCKHCKKSFLYFYENNKFGIYHHCSKSFEMFVESENSSILEPGRSDLIKEYNEAKARWNTNRKKK